jgi:hypothetical protein
MGYWMERAKQFQEDVTIPVGSQITWDGPDGKLRGPALVDFIHRCDDGNQWAFVTLRDGWAAVNSKYVLTIKEGDTPSAKR